MYGRFGWDWDIAGNYTPEYAKTAFNEITELIKKTSPKKIEGICLHSIWERTVVVPWSKGDKTTLYEPFYALQELLDQPDSGGKWGIDVGDGWIFFGLAQHVTFPASVTKLAIEIGREPSFYGH